MSLSRPRVIVTRKMPAPMEARITELYDAEFNATDTPFTPEQLSAALQNADIVVTTVTDKWLPSVLETPNRRAKLLANVGVGVNHIAQEAHVRRD